MCVFPDQKKGYSFDYNLYDECYDFDAKKQFGPWHHQVGRESPEWHMDGSPCGGIRVLRKWVNQSAVKVGAKRTS